MTAPITGYAGAAAAYRRAADNAAAMPSQEPQADGRGGFAGMVEAAVQNAVDTSERGEQAALAAMTGQADLADVVTAVAEAEVTLQTVVAVRDKVVSAYKDIMRMPI